MADPTAAIARLVTVLDGLSGMQSVFTGAPESLDSRVNAYVTLDRWLAPDKATSGLLQHEIDVLVTFGYRVAGAEATAETTLAGLVGAFVTAMLTERVSRLNGTVSSVSLPDFSRATEPQYAVVAGTEFRLYPGIVRLTIQEAFV